MLAALAHHYAAAAPVGGVERAVAYNLLAAESASSALAFGRGGGPVPRRARARRPRPAERADVMLRLGDVCHRAGRADAALDAFSRAPPRSGARSCDARDPRPGGDRLRGGVLAPRDPRRGGRRAARGGGRGPRAGGLGAPRARSRRARARARAARRAGARRARARRGDRDVAPPRRPADARDDRSPRPTGRAGAPRTRRSTACSSRRGTSARELEDVEIEGAALSWLVPSYVVLCDHDAARETLGAAAPERAAVERAVHAPRRRALRGRARPLRRRPRGGRAGRRRSQEWGRLLTGRDASGTYAIQMFGLRREQGRLAELAPVVRLLDAETRDGAWGPGLAALLAELGMDDDARRELAPILDDGIGSLRPSLWLGVARLPRRRLRGARRRGRGAGALPGARALRGRQRDDRPPRRLLRRDGPLPRHDCGGPRRLGPGGGALPRRARAQHAARRADVARAHRVLVRPHAPGARRRRRPVARPGAARCRARSRPDDRAAGARPAGGGARRGRRAGGARAAPTA